MFVCCVFVDGVTVGVGLDGDESLDGAMVDVAVDELVFDIVPDEVLAVESALDMAKEGDLPLKTPRLRLERCEDNFSKPFGAILALEWQLPNPATVVVLLQMAGESIYGVESEERG